MILSEILEEKEKTINSSLKELVVITLCYLCYSFYWHFMVTPWKNDQKWLHTA